MAWWWSLSKHVKKIVRCSGEVIMRGVVLAPQEPRSATLVERVSELHKLTNYKSNYTSTMYMKVITSLCKEMQTNENTRMTR